MNYHNTFDISIKKMQTNNRMASKDKRIYKRRVYIDKQPVGINIGHRYMKEEISRRPESDRSMARSNSLNVF